MANEYDLLTNGKPTIIEFHLISGKRLVLDLKELDVEFYTASNKLFMTDDYKIEAEDVMKAITDLKPDDSIYICTRTKEGTELDKKTEPFDKKRTYLTQRSKIAYVRVSQGEAS